MRIELGKAGRTAALAASWLVPATASAFCRTTTVEPISTCPEVCSLTGIPLHWDTPDHIFYLNVPTFPSLGEADVRRIIGKSFATWQAVRCGDLPVEYRFTLAAQSTSEGAVHRVGASNISVLAYEDATTWSELAHSPSAFAVTTLAYVPSTGVITETDIEFNGGMPTWAECPPEGCISGELRTDFENVLTHELGHTLGLAHSGIDAATMSCSASPSDTDKRSLDADDIIAICGTYPPGAAFGSETNQRVQGVTCSAVLPARGAFFRVFAAGLALFSLSRRLRARRSRRTNGRDS